MTNPVYSLTAVAHEFGVRLKPWWFCCGWRSYWCVLDRLTRCKVRAVCDAHDRAITGE